MPQPPRAQKRISPPSYTTNVQRTSSESSITGCSISPSDSASARAYPPRYPQPLMYPSFVNDRARLLGSTVNGKPPGYQTIAQGLPSKNENVRPALTRTTIMLTYLTVALFIIFILSRSESDPSSRADLRWEEMRPAETCLRYGTREYTARLPYISWWYDRVSVCRETKGEIHGRLMKPDYCEDKGGDGIWGKWIIDFHEPTCTTWWSNFADKGCTARGSGLRRFEQRLENIPWGSDWREMCSTAPADFLGRHFDTPTSCANWGRHGVFGYWEISDSSC